MGRRGPLSRAARPRQLAPVPPVQPAAPTSRCRFRWGCRRWISFRAGSGRGDGRRLRTQSRFDLAPGDPGGDPLLRRAIVDYLRLSRSIDCQPDQVLITGSYAASMNLILRTGAAGTAWKIRGIPLSGRSSRLGSWRWMLFRWTTKDGRRLGPASSPQARFALLTPAHQSPLGSRCRFPTPPAAGVGRGARRVDREDDYDSEFRYHGKPLPPLKSLDAPQRVIYAGTFSKSMFPALRTAWWCRPAGGAFSPDRGAPVLHRSHPVAADAGDFIQQGHFGVI